MKIKKADLDNELLTYFQNIDKMKSNYNGNSNFISCDGKEFSLNYYNEFSLKTVFTNTDIENLENALYDVKNNYLTSFNNDMNDNNYSSTTFPSLLRQSESLDTFIPETTIYFIKEINDFIIVITNNGILYKINKNDIKTYKTYEVFKTLSKTFVDNFSNSDKITDVTLNGNIIIFSTLFNGIFTINENNEYECIIKELYVDKINYLNNNKLLVYSKRSKLLCIYSLENYLKTEVYNQLNNCNQDCIDIALHDDCFYVLSKDNSCSPSGNLLHVYRSDFAEITYLNIDDLISKNSLDMNYQVKFIKVTNENIYVSGVYNNNMFIWKYSSFNILNDIETYIYDKIDIKYDNYTYFNIINDKIYTVIEDRLLTFDFDFNILSNIKLNNNYKYVLITDNLDTYASNGYMIDKINLIKDESTNSIVLNIIKNSISNNIDILIKTKNYNDNVVLTDSDTLLQIKPYFYARLNNEYSLIKLINCKSKNINMSMNLVEGSIIEGVVVHKNTALLK